MTTQITIDVQLDSPCDYHLAGYQLALLCDGGETRDKREHLKWWFRHRHAGKYVFEPRTLERLRQARECGVFVSRAYAKAVMLRSPTKLVYEHARPLAVIHEGARRLTPLTREALEKYLVENYRVGLITEEEDRKLDGADLKKKMPAGADPGDHWARYRRVAIEEWDGVESWARPAEAGLPRRRAAGQEAPPAASRPRDDER
jgi:hypothetical protein